eukprot:1391516-Rhodomonas_salina.3
MSIDSKGAAMHVQPDFFAHGRIHAPSKHKHSAATEEDRQSAQGRQRQRSGAAKGGSCAGIESGVLPSGPPAHQPRRRPLSSAPPTNTSMLASTGSDSEMHFLKPRYSPDTCPR